MPDKCAVCARRINKPKYTLTVNDYTDNRGDFQPHPVHGKCLDRLWKWTKSISIEGWRSKQSTSNA